ncbi:hypothetical protein OG21DRAFT_828961 [Imleria badia]|nr:hypothetical protein OG21DRAFT_828961 [Imleria badia]
MVVQSGLHATSLRIGQTAGGHGGSWATTDWFPIVVKSSITPQCAPGSGWCRAVVARGRSGGCNSGDDDDLVKIPATKLLEFLRALVWGDDAAWSLGVGSTEAAGMSNFSTGRVRKVSVMIANMQAIGEEEADAWVGCWISKGAF